MNDLWEILFCPLHGILPKLAVFAAPALVGLKFFCNNLLHGHNPCATINEDRKEN